ncbi:hypothetical protein AMS68_002315 [Peltaster fructicola]|uniref:Uncharacterized protein n=1 Tax=Peltaster fructicola TaxID=286661 RepID=A0A6H0XQ83_9PEZI|nr:hypothetical protein AMS68_002315 [Peltaster fructicola]
MRGRRNTHLSNASTSSSSSTDTSATTSARTSLSEKDLEQCDYLLADDHKPKPRNPFIFYVFATAICISLFTGFSLWQCSTTTVESSPLAISPAAIPHKAGGLPFVDDAGKERWTIYIPPNDSFPLSTPEYQHLCRDAKRLRGTKWSVQQLLRPSGRDTFHDTSFMDVDAVEASGVLSTSTNISPGTCQKSLTFIMDGDASFGKTLLLLWMSYGYAKRDGRAFFLDDSAWAYGRYDSYFTPLPRPGCAPPPRSHLLPCPLQAKHLVITPTTARATFDEDVNDIFKRQLPSGRKKDAAVFDLVRSGYESTFHLIGDDASYAEQRVQQLRASANQHHQPLVGMHIRRGDLRPFELQFSQDYLPVERFTDAAKTSLGPAVDSQGILLLASDDPDIIDSAELTLAASPYHLKKTQERIQLATKLALDRTSPAEPIREPGSAYVKHVDENAGWDGGFYTGLFYSLGDTRSRQQRLLQGQLSQGGTSKETLRMRELVARGYLLDLAVLGQSESVVCAVSSAACRILGVMMGREAIQSGKWVNVDDNRVWSWDGRK